MLVPRAGGMRLSVLVPVLDDELRELVLELEDVDWLVCWDVVWVTVETVTVESIVTVTTEIYAPVSITSDQSSKFHELEYSTYTRPRHIHNQEYNSHPPKPASTSYTRSDKILSCQSRSDHSDSNPHRQIPCL